MVTNSDFGRALQTAISLKDDNATYLILQTHAPNAHHCNGWEREMWPCPVAIIELIRLFPDDFSK